MPDTPYTNRELDLRLGSLSTEIHAIAERLAPFERDVRESLSRVEMEINNIRTHIEDRIREEREITNKERAPMQAWTAILGFFGLLATAFILGILKKYLGI